jgi:hypothetical protein
MIVGEGCTTRNLRLSARNVLYDGVFEERSQPGEGSGLREEPTSSLLREPVVHDSQALVSNSRMSGTVVA